MGFNSTLVVCNDALHDIRDDKEYGRKVYEAIIRLPNRNSRGDERGIDICSNSFVNGSCVIETHHASGVVPVLVGGNTGIPIRDIYVPCTGDSKELELARKHGYRVSKAPKRKNAT